MFGTLPDADDAAQRDDQPGNGYKSAAHLGRICFAIPSEAPNPTELDELGPKELRRRRPTQLNTVTVCRTDKSSVEILVRHVGVSHAVEEEPGPSYAMTRYTLVGSGVVAPTQTKR